MVTWLHGYVYEVDSYEGSFSKWYLLRGANHQGMATIDNHKNRLNIASCDFYLGEVLPAPVSFRSAVYTAF